MKKTLTLLTLFTTLFTFSQNFQGKATYKTSRKSNIKIG